MPSGVQAQRTVNRREARAVAAPEVHGTEQGWRLL